MMASARSKSDAHLTPDMQRLHDVRIVIEDVRPRVDDGRYPVKRIVGEILPVQATIFRDGHDVLTAVLRFRRSASSEPRPLGSGPLAYARGSGDAAEWSEVPMTCINPGLDLWTAEFPLTEVATYDYTIEAWTNAFASWRIELRKKAEAGQDVQSELLEGVRLIEDAADRTSLTPRVGARTRSVSESLRQSADAIRSAEHQAEAVTLALDEGLAKQMDHHPDRRRATRHDREYQVIVDPPPARYAAWYELFPRSQSPDPNRPGTFRDCTERLPDIAAMGFDVIYLPPIHPIGRAFRKGKNNRLTAEPGEPGSPWAIGNELGGHKSIEPALGTLDDFRAFVDAARRHRIEIALDFAIQCSPDHPYVREHPEWFYHRPDGSIKYAENPPKKYQDIFPFNFDTEHWASLWEEMRSIILFWIGQGVRTFRVDNPHTKPLNFWEWLIREVKREHPDAIFLAEAFTRPPMMKALAKAGFTQSYTYFTWRNAKDELVEYLTELTQTEMAEYYRGNLFANTPDILHAFLQKGGESAFKIRLLLAATLSSVYGIYSGFEFCENVPLHEGSEEYLDSEKYEIRHRDWNAPGNIKDLIATINQARRENPALQLYDNLRFHPTTDPSLICYGKATPDFSNVVLVVVNLDPLQAHDGVLELDLAQLGVRADQEYGVEDRLTGSAWRWQGSRNYVRLVPEHQPGHLLVIRR